MERKLTTGQPDSSAEAAPSRRVIKAPSSRRSAGPFYLLIFEGDSTQMVDFPSTGTVVLGRSEAATIRFEDPSVADIHAEITLEDGEARLRDLAAGETRVNDERFVGTRLLGSADVISLGNVTLIFHQGQRSMSGRPILEFNRFQRRAAEEIERSLRYHRPLSVLALRLGLSGDDRAEVAVKLEGQLRLTDIAAWDGADRILILMPETGAEPAKVAADRLLKVLSASAPEARAGIATLPFDGCDIDTLLASARAATSVAKAGRQATAAESFRKLTLGNRLVLIADPAMIQLYELVERLAASDLPILICGETGTGKELVASAIHAWSSRRNRPVIPMNCAALHENLIESELFGHEKGAFTGSITTKPGLLELADGGTILLDEIGELSATAQAKLLRVLETKRVTRLGDVRERDINIRIVAATNRNLEDQVKAGRFRQDLYYRLKGALLWIPPLRDRARELPLLAKAFLEDACARSGRPPMTLAYSAMQALASYAWPGNVRELKNLMEFLAAAVLEREVEEWHIIDRLGGRIQLPTPSVRTLEEAAPIPSSDVRRRFRPIDEEVRELERTRMAEALAVAGGNQTRAAELIAMPLRTFVAKLKLYDIPRRSESFGKR
ncbi:MAG TPA: sigma 54-interacting transcriptional regulator [Polyangiaceae bacterium]|nr:sigma 54-interacting transcriptional regulator [Polyangiaceae bacterium]